MHFNRTCLIDIKCEMSLVNLWTISECPGTNANGRARLEDFVFFCEETYKFGFLKQKIAYHQMS